MQSNIEENVVLLKPNEEKRLDELFNKFSKQDSTYQTLKFSEFFQFVLDRSLINANITLSIMYDLFLDCVDSDKAIQKNIEKTINKSQFNFLLYQLSKVIYPNQKNHFEKMFQEVLAEKAIANKGQIELQRCPMFDETTKKLLLEPSIALLCAYEDELRNCYVSYLTENYVQQKLLLTWNEIALQNKKISSFAFLVFLKEAHILPNVISIETVNECMSKMMPATTQKEQEFYHKHMLIQIYEKEVSDGNEKKHEQDPQVNFHEFQLVLSRIAYEIFPKDQDKKDISVVLVKFFAETLGIRMNDSIFNEQLPNINKKLYRRLENYYKDLQNEQKLAQESFNNGNNNKQQEQNQDPLQKVIQQQEQLIFQAELKELDYNDILNNLNKSLPPLPPLPQVNQENPPPYKIDPLDKKKMLRVVIGDPVPKPPPEKPKPKAKPPKKKQLKKGEKPPKPIIWAGMPPPPYQRTADFLQKLNDNLEYGETILGDLKKGVMSDIPIIPVIIEEIIYPPKVPPTIRILVEAAVQSHNQQNYIFAITNFDQAKEDWQQLEQRELSDQINLFFLYSKGAVYSSAGRDDYALFNFMICKKICDKLPFNNPDMALAYCGLGSVLYNMEEYELSLRCYLKCREIREQFYGIEHPDTAATFNNLGCNMFMLERSHEAQAYFKMAEAVFNAELGPYHNRTLTAGKNMKKCNQYLQFENKPEFRTLWETYEVDQYPKKGKKKSGKKKKK